MTLNLWRPFALTLMEASPVLSSVSSLTENISAVVPIVAMIWPPSSSEYLQNQLHFIVGIFYLQCINNFFYKFTKLQHIYTIMIFFFNQISIIYINFKVAFWIKSRIYQVDQCWLISILLWLEIVNSGQKKSFCVAVLLEKPNHLPVSNNSKCVVFVHNPFQHSHCVLVKQV